MYPPIRDGRGSRELVRYVQDRVNEERGVKRFVPCQFALFVLLPYTRTTHEWEEGVQGLLETLDSRIVSMPIPCAALRFLHIHNCYGERDLSSVSLFSCYRNGPLPPSSEIRTDKQTDKRACMQDVNQCVMQKWGDTSTEISPAKRRGRGGWMDETRHELN